jgi:site-specific DNA-methyltransferase (adenine-specific)
MDMEKELKQEVWMGDCLELMKDIPDKSINMVLTDVPYGEVNRKSNGLRNLNKGVADILNFDLNEFLYELDRVCSGSFYIFCCTEQVSSVRSFFAKRKLSTRHCLWEKTNPSPMNGQHIWLSSVENCIFAKNKKAIFNEHCKSSVWRFPNGRSKIHPTEKPLKLFEYLIKTSSSEGDLVFDPCAGSGTTLVAAKNLNRQFVGIEKEKEFYDICLKRLSEVKNESN